MILEGCYKSWTFELGLETLRVSSLLSLSVGDASKNTISWTTFLGSFCCEKLGNQSDVPITCVKYLFWRTLLLKLQGFSARSRHLYVELWARANMSKSFDLLKTQLQIILSEVIVSFIGCSVCCFLGMLHLGHLSAVSSVSLTWKLQDGIYLLNCFLTDKLRIPQQALVSQNKQKVVLWAFVIYSILCLWKIFATNICTFWNFSNFSYLPGFNSQTVDSSDCIEN